MPSGKHRGLHRGPSLPVSPGPSGRFLLAASGPQPPSLSLLPTSLLPASMRTQKSFVGLRTGTRAPPSCASLCLPRPLLPGLGVEPSDGTSSKGSPRGHPGLLGFSAPLERGLSPRVLTPGCLGQCRARRHGKRSDNWPPRVLLRAAGGWGGADEGPSPRWAPTQLSPVNHPGSGEAARPAPRPSGPTRGQGPPVGPYSGEAGCTSER